MRAIQYVHIFVVFFYFMDLLRGPINFTVGPIDYPFNDYDKKLGFEELY